MDKKRTQPSKGLLTITHKALSYEGETFLLANIAKFTQYKLTRIYRFSILHLVIAAIFFLGFINHMYWGLIFVLPAAYVLIEGIRERRLPQLYCVHLELSSGSHHEFISTDIDGIKKLYADIGTALHNHDAPINHTYNFTPEKIIVNSGDTYNTHNSQVGAIGQNASASQVNFSNSPESNPNS